MNNGNVQPPASAPPAFNPNLGQGQFTGFTAAQTAVITAAVVAAVAATIFAAIFVGVFALAVVGVAAVGITVLALSFKNIVIANETYYLHNPHITRVRYTFAPDPYIRNWYSTYRPQIIRVQPPVQQYPQARVRPNTGVVNLAGSRQIPGTSMTTTAVPTHDYRTSDRGTPARMPPSHDYSTPARVVPSYDRGTSARVAPSYDRGTSARMTSSFDHGSSARANAPATRGALGGDARVQVGGRR